MILISCETPAIVVTVVVLGHNFSLQPSWLLCVIHPKDHLMLNLMSAVYHWLVVCLDSKVEVGKERKAQQKRLKLSEHIG